MSQQNPRLASTSEDVNRTKPMILPLVLTMAAIVLAVWTTQLPFTAGSQLVDLFAPVGAAVFGAAATILTFRQRRHATGAVRGWLLMLGLVGAAVAVAAGLTLLLIFGLCGAYWMRTGC